VSGKSLRKKENSKNRVFVTIYHGTLKNLTENFLYFGRKSNIVSNYREGWTFNNRCFFID
jgi:hypothetical protein